MPSGGLGASWERGAGSGLGERPGGPGEGLGGNLAWGAWGRPGRGPGRGLGRAWEGIRPGGPGGGLGGGLGRQPHTLKVPSSILARCIRCTCSSFWLDFLFKVANKMKV